MDRERLEEGQICPPLVGAVHDVPTGITGRADHLPCKGGWVKESGCCTWMGEEGITDAVWSIDSDRRKVDVSKPALRDSTGNCKRGSRLPEAKRVDLPIAQNKLG